MLDPKGKVTPDELSLGGNRNSPVFELALSWPPLSFNEGECP